MSTAHHQEPREFEHQGGASFLAARLDVTRAELRVVREQREILRRALIMAEAMAEIEAKDSPAWAKALDDFRCSLRLTA